MEQQRCCLSQYIYVSYLDLAKNGAASQTSTNPGYPASRVIDGVLATCSHTFERTVNSFIMLDSRKTAEVFQITIFNRIDSELVLSRLNNFSIFIGKTLDTLKTCVSNENMSSDSAKTFECHFVGRYLKIQLHIAEWLHLCEVVVMGKYL